MLIYSHHHTCVCVCVVPRTLCVAQKRLKLYAPGNCMRGKTKQKNLLRAKQIVYKYDDDDDAARLK